MCQRVNHYYKKPNACTSEKKGKGHLTTYIHTEMMASHHHQQQQIIKEKQPKKGKKTLMTDDNKDQQLLHFLPCKIESTSVQTHERE